VKIDDLIEIKNNDLQVPRNTYLVPIKRFNNFDKGEMFWLKRFENRKAVLFRTRDGLEYFLTEENLKNFKLTGR
jgi:hypothetical protein